MSALDNKIPPPVVALVFAALGWLVASITPSYFTYHSNHIMATPLIVAGLSIVTVAVLLFFRQKTTINPHTPHKSSRLVVTGLYKYTRNPMYLGLLLTLSGLVALMGSWLSFVVLPGFIFYINQFQIKPEERHLSELFGEDYVAYQKQVRRWL